MRIAVFYNNPWGGSGRVVAEIGRRLKASFERVGVYTLCKPTDGMPQLADLSPMRPYTYERLPSIARPFGRFHPLIALADLVRLNRTYQKLAQVINDQYDAALVFQCYETSAPFLLRHLTIPSVLYTGEPIRTLYEPPIARPLVHGRLLGKYSLLLDHLDPLVGLYKSVLRREEVLNARSASRVATNSCYSREVLYRVYGVNAHVVYPGVDTNVFRPVPEVTNGKVLSVGHTTPMKGHDFVISALSHFPAGCRPGLVIAGNVNDHNEKEYLIKLASESEVHVTFESAGSDTEIVRRYNRAAVFAFAPVMEPLGLAPLESMACCVPVVGVREAGVRETVTEGKGGLLADRVPELFAEKLGRLLGDSRLRRQMGELGREYVKREWSWDSCMTKLLPHLTTDVTNIRPRSFDISIQ